MALTSDNGIVIPELFESEDIPSRTWKIDWETMRVTRELIDEVEAIKQFVIKALFDRRDTHIIYTSDYGSEIEEVLASGYNEQLLKTEVTRVITEALIYDERISAVDSFEFARGQQDEGMVVSFRVVTARNEEVGIEGVALNV